MANAQISTSAPRIVGRYALHRKIASGGMATVHVGRLLGPVGFSRTVAIKTLHAHLASDPEFTAMFLDEARLAAKIRHPNVVPTFDVVATSGELFLVMEYIHGESLHRLIRLGNKAKQPLPFRSAVSIISGALQGLHAAHQVKNDHGAPLNLVHRDMSPHNILVGDDGASRILDFGVAKAMGQVHTTREGNVRGKVAYMSPEQIRGEPASRLSDIWATSAMLWEALVGRRLFDGKQEGQLLFQVMETEIQKPSDFNKDVPAALDAVVLKGLNRNAKERFQTAKEMATALEEAHLSATQREVAEWVNAVAKPQLDARAEIVASVESSSAQIPLDDDEAATLLRHSDASIDAPEMTSDGLEVLPRDGAPAKGNRLLWAGTATLVPFALFGMWAMVFRAPSDTESEAKSPPATVAADTTVAVVPSPPAPPTEPEPSTAPMGSGDALNAMPSATASAGEGAATATTTAKGPPATWKPPPKAGATTGGGPDPSLFGRK